MTEDHEDPLFQAEWDDEEDGFRPDPFDDEVLRELDRLIEEEERLKDVDTALVGGIERPFIEVLKQDRFGRFTPPWDVFEMTDETETFRRPVRCTGRVQLVSGGQPTKAYLGSGFFVGPRFFLTNRHVALSFIKGRTFLHEKRVEPIKKLQQNESRVVVSVRPDPDESAELLDVVAIQLVHPYWDLAVLEVDRDRDAEHLTLMADRPENLFERKVLTIGYPGKITYRTSRDLDERQARFLNKLQQDLLGNGYGRKHVQPGLLIGLAERSQAHFPQVHALTHDCNTQKGNSGSMLWDVQSRTVIGIHYGGEIMKRNYAVPAWELAQDPRLTRLGIFEPAIHTQSASQPPAWLSHWEGFPRNPSVSLKQRTPGPNIQHTS